jgi:hypothetical protein
MIRPPVLGILGVVGITAFMLAKCVSSAAVASGDAAPLVVDMSAHKIAGKLQSATVSDFFRARHSSDGRFPGYIRSSTSVDKDNQVYFTVRLGGDLVMKADAHLAEFKNGQTQVDIKVDMTESRFTRNETLNSGDEEALEAMLDVMITEYVASLLNDTSMLSGKELEKKIYQRTGLSSYSAKAFTDRVKDAFEESYGRDIELAAERESSYHSGGYSDDYSGYRSNTHYGSGRFGDPSMTDSSNRPYYGGGGTDAAAAAAAAAIRSSSNSNGSSRY